MHNPLMTAQAAIDSAASKGSGAVAEWQSSFICPFPNCRAFALHTWGNVANVGVQIGQRGQARHYRGSPVLTCAECAACGQEVIFVDRKLIYPAVSEAPPAAKDLPAQLADDYEEASRIAAISPRGAAALLRLAIQKLCPVLGATKKEINAAIGELVTAGTITTAIQKALDSVRVIGNEAVHPGTMDLKDNAKTALALFGLVNFIVEKAITEPKELQAIYDSLPPNKLAGIDARDQAKT